MSRINVLEKHVAELIAAGEVIDRPCSVIKELVENSIDAGATAVTVEIKNGGISYMRVTDDGCGIAAEDVRTAFIRHATSKIYCEEDLNSIATFGFRGEALASVAAMAKVELITKTADSQLGCRYVTHGSEEVCFDEAGCPAGTTIIVRDLFFNTPARMKFLKKDVAEGNAVAAVMDRIALSNPDVSVKFIRDSKITLHTPGNGDLYSALYAIFGREQASGFVPVDFELGGISVKGYITKPEFARSSRAMQYFFVNSRYVKTKTVMAAVEEAFKGFIVTGKFPGCVLDVRVPYSAVDVNVHPAKIEVRFVNERPIFDCVYSGVKSVLASLEGKKELSINNVSHRINPFTVMENVRAAQQSMSDSLSDKNIMHSAGAPSHLSSSAVSEKYNTVSIPYRETRVEPSLKPATSPSVAVRVAVEHIPEKNPDMAKQNSTSSVLQADIPKQAKVEPDDVLEQKEAVPMRVIGELFSTYIIAESGNDMILIDKHAAHERLIYEKLKRENTEIDRQLLISPVIINLPKESHSAVCESAEVFNKAGFSIEDFGNFSVAVREIPVIVRESDIEPIVTEIADSIVKNKSADSFEFADRLYHSIACRSAIKANDRSFTSELESLVKDLTANPDVKYCPHGRPIYIKLTKRELEKQFGRIQ